MLILRLYIFIYFDIYYFPVFYSLSQINITNGKRYLSIMPIISFQLPLQTLKNLAILKYICKWYIHI